MRLGNTQKTLLIMLYRGYCILTGEVEAHRFAFLRQSRDYPAQWDKPLDHRFVTSLETKGLVHVSEAHPTCKFYALTEEGKHIAEMLVLQPQDGE